MRVTKNQKNTAHHFGERVGALTVGTSHKIWLVKVS